MKPLFHSTVEREAYEREQTRITSLVERLVRSIKTDLRGQGLVLATEVGARSLTPEMTDRAIEALARNLLHAQMLEAEANR